MNARRLTPPLLIALSVSSVCTLALSRKIKHPAVQQIAMTSYIAAAKSMPAGDVVRAESVQRMQWPADHPLPGAFVKPADVAGRTLLFPVEANQPLTEQLLSAPGAGSGLAARIPDGMRAVALKSDEVTGVAGFLVPGCSIDVLVTLHTDGVRGSRTVTVLQNAKVLAAGQQIQPDPQGKPATVSVVTLLLSPGDAERAVLASSEGNLHFIMRSGSDRDSARDTGITLAQLEDPSAAPLSRSQAGPAARPVRPSSPPRPVHQSTVETISGDKQVITTFPDGLR